MLSRQSSLFDKKYLFEKKIHIRVSIRNVRLQVMNLRGNFDFPHYLIPRLRLL